jgi:putative DNA primase/helicase
MELIMKDEDAGTGTGKGTGKGKVAATLAPLKYSKDINIATASSRKAVRWKNQAVTIQQFVSKLSRTIRTNETMEEYRAMPKSEQDTIKDVGAFVGGTLKGGRRRKKDVSNRSFITLDLDYATKETLGAIKSALAGVCWTLYSTHKHTVKHPRYRLLVYGDRAMAVGEYKAISRKVAASVGIEWFDETSHDVNRLFYWPSTSSDGDYVFEHNDAEYLGLNGVLAEYGPDGAWADALLWPQSSRETRVFDRMVKRQADPLGKKGVVGSFCRVVPLKDAIGEYLGDVYKAESGDRYTFIEGSSTGGLVLYDDRFAFSNHATDPCCGILCNAFDLVRIHRFGHLDEEVRAGVSTLRLPSYTEMISWAREVEGVKVDMVQTGIEIDATAFDVFDAPGVAGSPSAGWEELLQLTEGGAMRPTVFNAMTIVQNDARLSGRMRFNAFSEILEREDGTQWGEEDYLKLRKYVGGRYGPDFSEKNMEHAIEKRGYENAYHPVRDFLWGLEWDGVGRLAGVFVNYFGCADNVYVRDAALCWFVAAVRRVMTPGFKFDFTPVVSGDQGIGKSSFLRVLGYEKWYGELSSFDPKIAMEEISGKWLVEINEMGATNKQALETQKSFLSAGSTRTRLAYRRNAKNYMRQCVFLATTNLPEYLKDATGNRRWWPLEATVGEVKIGRLERERDQLWAEAMMIWAQGFDCFLSKEAIEIAMASQEGAREEDEWEGMIGAYIEREAYVDRYMSLIGSISGPLEPRDRVCFAEIWADCLERKGKAWPADKTRVRQIMKKMEEWEAVSLIRFGVRFGRQRGWKIKKC